MEIKKSRKKPFIVRDLDFVAILSMNQIVPVKVEVKGRNLFEFIFEDTDELKALENEFYSKHNEIRRFCTEKKFIKSYYQLKAERQNTNEQ